MPDSIPTGIEGLDRVLCGGVLRGATVLVEGTPGAGKTTLGMQFIYAGIIKYDQPGLIVTFEEFPQQMYRDAEQLGWDLRKLSDEGKLRIISTSPAVFQQETAGPDGMISQIAREAAVERVMIDSVSHFQRLTRDPAEQREIFNGLVNMLKRGGYTSFFTKEVRLREEQEVSFEEYASDAAIRLTYESTGTNRRVRMLEVIKARGQNFLPGKHFFEIGKGGITVYPSFVPEEYEEKISAPEIERVPSGVEGLDEMLGGGLIRGFSTLIIGPAGTGKTAIGLQFLAEGIARGEPCVLVTLKDPPAKVAALASSIGINIFADPKLLTVIHEPFVHMNPYAILSRAIRAVDDTGARRLFVDGLAEVEDAVVDQQGLEAFIYQALQEVHRRGVTAMFSGSSHGAQGAAELAELGPASLADTVISLRYVEARGEIRMGLSILKTKGGGRINDIRPYEITSRGVRVITRRVTVLNDRSEG